MNDKLRLVILRDIDDCFFNAEKMILANDDPSGCRTEFVLDTEAFRENLQRKIEQLEREPDDN